MPSSGEPTQAADAKRSLVGDWVFALAAGAASVAFALNLGLNYGVNNQVSYLVQALRLVHPGILERDWFATEPTHFHPAFTYLGALLISLNRAGWGVALFHVLAVSAGMMAFYWLAVSFFGRARALAVFLLFVAICFLTQTRSVALSYAFDAILQPSTVGSLFFVLSLPFYLEARWLRSGICVALSGLFHANYLVLSVMVFGLCHLSLQRREGFDRARLKEFARRLAAQLGPAVPVFLLLSPLFLHSAATVDHDPSPLDILFKIRSPHHYLPSSFSRDFMPVAAWHLIGIGAAWPLLRDLPGRVGRMGALLASMLVLVWVGTALTTAIYEIRVAQLFVWRLAPYSEMLCQLLTAGVLVRAIAEPRFTRRFSAIQVGLVAAGLGLFFAYLGANSAPWRKIVVQCLVVLALAKLVHFATAWLKARGPIAGASRVGAHAASAIPLLLAGVLLVRNAEGPLSTYRQRSNLITGLHVAERELVDWMRTSTPRDAIFLTPPAVETLRYHGQRAIVVDWKTHPMLLDEVVGWFRRIQDVTGRERFRGPADLAGYDTLDQTRLDFLKQKYAVDYVVVGPGREHGLRGQRVFQNRGFVVLDVR